MSTHLVIVESPAKAKTIKKYLGKDFEVLASYGHVRDLVPKEGAVDPEHHFAMKYQVVERNQKHVDAIVRALKKAKSLYLATDPDREGEIAAFVAREYWTIDATLEHSEQKFPGKLVEYAGAKVEQFSFTTETEARDVERTLKDAAKGTLTVMGVDRKQRRRNPAPPFTTSTLQQEAARKLSFSAQKTMRVAQQLYEGVDIGEGAVGLITYMRTDSLNLAQEAIGQIRETIVQLYGKEGLAEEPRIYKTKSKNAQEAHEAIRPTAANILPNDIEKHLEADQFRLYSLIWKRTVACQMAPAIFDTVAVDMLAGEDGPKRTVLRANGSTLVKP